MTDMCRVWILFLVRAALTWPRLVKMSRCMNICTADGNKIPFLPQSWKWKTTPKKRYYHWREAFFTSMIMGGRVDDLACCNAQ